jgi:hypothetical protein
MIKIQGLSVSDMNRFILLWGIVILCISKMISTWVDFLSSVNLKSDKIAASAKLKDMDNVHQTVSDTMGFSTNVPVLSISKKERWVTQILATKFHTEPITEIELWVRLNPLMRDLIINEHTDKIYKQAAKIK